MKLLNNYKKSIVFALLVLTVASMVSCEKQLDNELQNSTYENAYWRTERDVEGAILGAYSLFRKSMFQDNAFFLWGDGPVGVFKTDDTNVAGMYDSGSFGVAYREQGAHNWTNWYQVVSQCNLVLEKLKGISDDKFGPGRKNELRGEAHFLRGLAYFYMTRVWGDLPLQLTAVTTADQAERIGRTPEGEVLKQIILDAQQASALLKWESVSTNRRIRASKGSALALLSHASAWQNDYSKTVLYTDSLISQSGLFTLQPKGMINKVFGNTTEAENILVIPNKSEDNEASVNSTIAFITISSDFINGMPSQNPVYYLNPVVISELYSNDDARKSEFIRFRNVSDLKPNLVKYSNIINIGSGGQNDLRAESNLIIFRLADIILLKAEALNALNRDAESNMELNKVRLRSGLADSNFSGIELKREILLERRRELVGEGHNYFDMIRNSRAFGTGGNSFYPPWMTKERFEKQGWRWPILNTIINTNPLINQNEWWKGRY